MKIHELKSKKGARVNNTRKGRGMGSGIGKTSGRGHKGQKARGRTKRSFGFEGGQMPLIRRIPKVGFTSKNKVEFNIVNIERLNIFKDDTHITPSLLKSNGLIGNRRNPSKILGKGEIKKKVKVSAHAFSKSAKSAIEKAGGSTELLKKF